MTHIVHVISSLQRGGAETLLVSLIKFLPDFKHTVIYLHDGPLRAVLIEHKIPVFKLTGFLKPYDPLALYRLHNYIDQLKPDIILSALWAANIVARIIGNYHAIPVLSLLHTVQEHEGYIRSFLEKILPGKPDTLIAVSPTIFTSFLPHATKQNILLITIPNGIDPSLFHPFSNAHPKHPKNTFTIGSVGRLVPVKQYPLLLESFAPLITQYHYPIKLLLIGTGPQERLLKKIITQYNLEQHVKLITNQAALPYYSHFDCFVQCSHYEGLSLALLEALWSKLPVIVTGDNYQHALITHNKTGLIVPTNNREALTQALLTIYHDHTLRTTLRENGYKLAQNFSIEKTAQQYRELINRTLLSRS